jgi:hypothetical protein
MRIVTGIRAALIVLVASIMLYSPEIPASKRGALPENYRSAPFQVGEELHYVIRWGIIPAGKGTLTISDSDGKNGVYHIVTTARSNAFVDTFYKVRNKIETFFDLKNDTSVRYKKIQREGTHRRNVDLIFDHHKNEATLIKNGKIDNELKVPAQIHDPLSAIYYLRTVKDLESGPVVLNVTDGKKNYQVTIHTLGRENVETPLGYFKTIKVEPVVKDMELIFDKKKDGKVFIWLTDDEKKVPVKMKSELAFGSIQVLLSEAKLQSDSTN